MISRASPGIQDIALLIELDDLRPAHTAERRSRPEFRGQFDGQGSSSPVDEPDMVHVVDVHARDLLHAPLVRQRFGPERIDSVLRRAIRIDRLALYYLCFSNRPGGIRHDSAQTRDQ